MEQPVENRNIVIKVKHGDVLRRFAAHFNGESLDHNMSTLRTKIIHLFKFSEDADLQLTYTDIDGDVVMLSSDNELYDAAIYQHLNPLRITVQVNGNTSTNNPTNNTSTNPSSRTMPALEFLPPQVSLAVEESLQNVPEPVRSTLTKISEEVSKVAATSPVMTELKDLFANLGQRHHVHTTGSASASQKDTNGSSNPKDANVSSNPVAPVDLLSDLTLPPLANWHGSTLEKEQIKTGNEAKIQKEDARDKGKSVFATASFSPPVIDHQQHIGLSSEPTTDIPIADMEGGNKKQCESSVPPSNFCGNMENGFTSSQQTSSDTLAGCHYGGWHCSADFGRRGPPGPRDGWNQVFHRGVSCDGCGMHPIVGPRYKSKVQEDYDLCIICFSEIGNEMDFTRIDRPVHRPPRPFRGFYGPHPVHHTFRNWGMRPPKEKLESRFIQDVTILDGTLIAPSTEFTKIWRLRNSGSTSWPGGTQLVWIGGDLLADKGSVELEIPTTGFRPSEEIDVAVDFRAPSMPGRYVSYWRLASPRGQKFGQRIWVLIQVENYGSNWQNSGAPFQCNWNATNSGEANPQPVVEVQNSSPGSSDIHVELAKSSSGRNSGEKPVRIELASQDALPAESGPVAPEMDFSAPYPITDSSTVLSNPVSSPVSFVPYPVVDTVPIPSSAPPEVNSPVSHPVVAPALASSTSPPVASATPYETMLDDATEQALLKELEELGFKEVELNKEILRKNDYDLEQSVNDLCSIAEWNPILEGLAEMGFHDKEKNIKLLAKNGGSFKRTVLDLISGKEWD